MTPPLDGMILPGVTRDSVLALGRGHASGTHRLDLPDKFIVTERQVPMKEVQEASKNGSLVELFGAGAFYNPHPPLNVINFIVGTAAVITTVDKIGYLGEEVIIPTGSDGMGPVSRIMWKELVGRQTGVIPSEWSVEI